jgi:hypothetical protein
MKQKQDSRFLKAFERLFSPTELDTLERQAGFTSGSHHSISVLYLIQLFS